MAKRAAKSSRRGIFHSPEPLESRVLLSASIGPVVNVMWNGQSAPAVADQYVAKSSNFAALGKLALIKGFTNVQSLGGKGFYQFDSNLPASDIARIGKHHTTALAVVQPNFVQQTAATPNDPNFSQQWYLSNTGQLEPYDYNLDGIVSPDVDHPSPPFPNEQQVGTVGQDDNVQQAWNITTGSPDVVVAVLDTGIDLNHPDLAANIWSNPFYATHASTETSPEGFVNDLHGWNFVDNNNDVTDLNGHGTNVAGIIGAVGNNGVGVTGMNWNVKILPVKVLDASGFGTDAGIIAGINFVVSLKDQGINVVAMNESLGGPGFPLDILTSNAVRAAGQVGILDVVAAGNSSVNNDNSPSLPANFSLSHPNVITVAATDNTGRLANFSNFGGQSVDLAAPGVDIFSTSPTYPVTLNAEVALTPEIPQFPLNYGFLSGTSQATPQVTGIIALEAAANPNATPAQLKAALLNGVTPDPFLASVNGLQPKVRTSGVANAFNAVMNIRNQFVATDTTRLGNWQGVFGSAGAFVVGDSTAFPSFVNASITGASLVTLHTSPRNQIAPQTTTDPAARVAAYEQADDTETVDLTFTDGLPHRVSLYLANLDHKRRSEQVQLIDATSGMVLDTQTVSPLKKGEYLTWDVQDPVQIKLTNLGGPNVAFSGIFFDTPPTDANAAQGVDTTTQGAAWRNQYGSQGASIVGDGNSQLPAYVTSLTTTANTTVLQANTADKHALQKAVDLKHNIKAYWNSDSSFDINVAFNDTQVHQVTLYADDYQHRNRSERIEAIDSNTGSVLATQDLSKFSQGAFVRFNVSGNVIFRAIATGKSDAVVSGVFFDAPAGEKVHFEGVDATTRGDWKSAGYGTTHPYIVGDNFPGADGPPDSIITSLTGATENILANPSNDPRALLKNISGANRARVKGYIFSTTSMTLNLDPGDLQTHRLELYFADLDTNNARTETVTFTDPATSAVLARQQISKFSKGKYFLYDFQGPVAITVSATSLPNAALSGVFLD
jgi:subtilisin family serine protease